MDPAARISYPLRSLILNVLLRASRTDPVHDKRHRIAPVTYDIYHDLTSRCTRDSLNGKNRQQLVAAALRLKLQSQTFLHTHAAHAPAPHHEHRSLSLWRDGRGKLAAQLALHLTHLSRFNCWGNVVVHAAGDLTVFYEVKYRFLHNPISNAHVLTTVFAYATLTPSRNFRLSPGHDLSPTNERWLEKEVQKLPRILQKERPQLHISQEFFSEKVRHVERQAYGIVSRIQDSAIGTGNDAGSNDGGSSGSSVPDGRLPQWYHHMCNELANHAEYDAAAVPLLALLKADCTNKSVQQRCARMVTANKFYTCAGAVSYLRRPSPAPTSVTSSYQSSSSTSRHTRIADESYEPGREANKRKIVQLRQEREEYRKEQRTQREAQASNAADGRNRTGGLAS